jgi:decaprenylphospho-beta-D-ribofuranose 2-oxidase
MTYGYKSLPVTGWGRYPTTISDVYRPERRAEVAAIVGERRHHAFIARGFGRSYGDAALNARQSVISGERLNRFLDFDETTGVLLAEAGVQLKEILDVFVPRGWFLPVTPGTKFVSLGGAVACDIHGKNHHCDESFSRHVEYLDLLLASGEIIRCSKTQRSDAFWATAGGMGLTGVILTVALKLQRIETAHMTVDYVRTRDLDETLERCETGDADYRYSVCWIDCLASGESLGRSVLMRGEHTRVAQLPARLRAAPLAIRSKTALTVPFSFPNFAINPLSVKAFNFFYYHAHPKEKTGVITDYDTYFYPLDFALEWNRIYGTRGFLQYQPVFPLDASRQALIQTLEILSRRKVASFLAVLKRFGPQEGLLSFPMPGYTLALDIPVTGPELLQTLAELDALVVKAGGRVYLGKDARLSPHDFAAMYPKLDEWKRIKRALDPNAIFSSDLSRRIGLTE